MDRDTLDKMNEAHTGMLESMDSISGIVEAIGEFAIAFAAIDMPDSFDCPRCGRTYKQVDHAISCDAVCAAIGGDAT